MYHPHKNSKNSHSGRNHHVLAVVLGIVRGGFEGPDVGTHGGFAIFGVLLGIERLKVGRLFRRVFQTRVHRCRDGCELTPVFYLVGR